MKKILIALSFSLLSTNAFASGECKEGETAYTNKCVNNNCTFCFNSTTQDLRIVPNSDVQEGDAVIIQSSAWGYSVWRANNVTIEEGVTGAQDWVFSSGGIVGCSTCTLKLPSTFDTLDHTSENYKTPFWYNQFGIVDLSEIKNLDLWLPTEASQNIIPQIQMSQSVPLSITIGQMNQNTI